MNMLMTAAMLIAGAGQPGQTSMLPGGDYPPCTKLVIDSCIQSGEREPDGDWTEEEISTGVGGPFEAVEEAIEDHVDARPLDDAVWTSTDENDVATPVNAPFPA